MKVYGTVVIDLTRLRLDSSDALSTAKAALWSALCGMPEGADVRLIVPKWDWWSPFAGQALLEMGDGLGRIDVESSDAATVGEWVRLLRQGARAIQPVKGW